MYSMALAKKKFKQIRLQFQVKASLKAQTLNFYETSSRP